MNPPPEPLIPAARIALVALTLLGLIGGWMILLTGSFTHTNGRNPHNITVVDGPMALAMAALDFTMTAIGVAALVQARGGGKAAYLIGCGLIIAPPLLFLLMQGV